MKPWWDDCDLDEDGAVGSVSVAQHGGSLHVRDTVRSRGGATAPRSTTGYYLARVRIGGRLVGRLRPGKSSRGSRTLTIPTSIAPGSYRLLACADERMRIRESSERNNCRAAPQLVQVSDRTPPLFVGVNSATTCIPGPAGGEVRARDKAGNRNTNKIERLGMNICL